MTRNFFIKIKNAHIQKSLNHEFSFVICCLLKKTVIKLRHNAQEDYHQISTFCCCIFLLETFIGIDWDDWSVHLFHTIYIFLSSQFENKKWNFFHFLRHFRSMSIFLLLLTGGKIYCDHDIVLPTPTNTATITTTTTTTTTTTITISLSPPPQQSFFEWKVHKQCLCTFHSLGHLIKPIFQNLLRCYEISVQNRNQNLPVWPWGPMTRGTTRVTPYLPLSELKNGKKFNF